MADRIERIQFSPNGHWLAISRNSWLVATGDRIGHRLELWDVANRRHVSTFEDNWQDYCFSPDGQTLVLQNNDMQSLLLWDTVTQSQRTKIQGAFGPVTFSPDSQRLASAGGQSEELRGPAQARIQYVIGFVQPKRRRTTYVSGKLVKVWNVLNGEELLTLSGHSLGIGAIAFAPDGHTLATGTGNAIQRPPRAHGEVKLWQLDPPIELSSIPLSGQSEGSFVGGLWFDDRGRFLQVIERRPSIRWQLRDFNKSTPIRGRLVVDDKLVGSSEGYAQSGHLWSNSLKNGIAAFPDRDDPDGCVLSPDGSLFALRDEHMPQQRDLIDNIGRFFGIRRKYIICNIQLVNAWTGRAQTALCDCRKPQFAPDGLTLAATGRDEEVVLWDVPPRVALITLGGRFVVLLIGLLAFGFLLRRWRSQRPGKTMPI
jgi:WD40 repeat protein